MDGPTSISSHLKAVPTPSACKQSAGQPRNGWRRASTTPPAGGTPGRGAPGGGRGAGPGHSSSVRVPGLPGAAGGGRHPSRVAQLARLQQQLKRPPSKLLPCPGRSHLVGATSAQALPAPTLPPQVIVPESVRQKAPPHLIVRCANCQRCAPAQRPCRAVPARGCAPPVAGLHACCAASQRPGSLP